MNLVTFTISYIEWHYTRGIRDVSRALTNITLFVVSFFSIPTLAMTLFSPWRRLGEDRKSGLDLEDLFTVLIVNTILRALGFVIRFMTISIGLVVVTFTLVVGVVALILWILWPVVIFTLVVNGLYFLWP